MRETDLPLVREVDNVSQRRKVMKSGSEADARWAKQHGRIQRSYWGADNTDDKCEIQV